MEDPTTMVKLTIKRRGFEISTEGTTTDLSKQLEVLSKFIDTVSEGLELPLEEKSQEAELHPSQSEGGSQVSTPDIPVIKPTSSTRDNIRALFNTSWGKTPRNLAEIGKALDLNAAPDASKVVASHLVRLVKRGELRRVQREGKYSYFRVPGSA